jgi:hypothetical protein
MLLRTALLSCAFYLGFVLVVELTLVAVARWKGSAGLFFNGWSWALFSGLIWLVSTSLAFRIIANWIRAKLAKQ